MLLTYFNIYDFDNWEVYWIKSNISNSSIFMFIGELASNVPVRLSLTIKYATFNSLHANEWNTTSHTIVVNWKIAYINTSKHFHHMHHCEDSPVTSVCWLFRRVPQTVNLSITNQRVFLLTLHWKACFTSYMRWNVYTQEMFNAN